MLQEGCFHRGCTRRLVPFLTGLFLLPGLLLGAKSARAQEADASSVPTKEVLTLFDDLDDLDKLHYLNPVPIHEIGKRWIGKFERSRLQALSDMKKALETR